jgi:hypothetical protein
MTFAPASHSQHFIFLLSYEQAQCARALEYTTSERFARDKRSSLLGPFVS